MWSAVFLLTGQDGKLLFTCLIHVLDRNTNSVCVCVSLCVCMMCESGPRDVLSAPWRAAYSSSHWSKEQSASVSPVGSPLFLSASGWWLSFVHVLYLIHLFVQCSDGFSLRVSAMFLLQWRFDNTDDGLQFRYEEFKFQEQENIPLPLLLLGIWVYFQSIT